MELSDLGCQSSKYLITQLTITGYQGFMDTLVGSFWIIVGCNGVVGTGQDSTFDLAQEILIRSVGG